MDKQFEISLFLILHGKLKYPTERERMFSITAISVWQVTWYIPTDLWYCHHRDLMINSHPELIHCNLKSIIFPIIYRFRSTWIWWYSTFHIQTKNVIKLKLQEADVHWQSCVWKGEKSYNYILSWVMQVKNKISILLFDLIISTYCDQFLKRWYKL